MPEHIAALIILEGVLGDGVVGRLRVEHAESIVVLRGEDHVFHSGILACRGPLAGVEVSGTELVGQSPVPVQVLLIGAGGVAGDPVLIADAPRLHDARNGIDAPVQQHAEFQVLPLLEVLHYIRFCGPFVSVRLLVQVVLLCYGRCRAEQQGKGSGSDG